MFKIVVANWKMYPTLSDSVVLAASYKKALDSLAGVEVVIAPPIIWLPTIVESYHHRSHHIHFAAQNVWPEDQGAYTGEVSAYLVKDLVSYAIVGHSERRQYAAETNDLIGEKIHACLRWQIKPIVCIGETEPVLDKNDHLTEPQWGKLRTQLLAAFEGVAKERFSRITVAYEPIWAIGSQNPATAHYTEAVIKQLRRALADKHGESAAPEVRFLYGGSVGVSNASSYLRSPEIAGLLVGSVSLKAKEFIEICEQASQLRAT